MSPGRAWSALMILRSFLPASALRTHVCTAAQPVPSILWPAFWSDHVMKLAHHGLPGPTSAAARYSSTSLPVLVPASCTPSWLCATLNADAPRVLPAPPGAPAAAAVASTMPGTAAGAATALAGPAGGWAAMNMPDAPFFPPLASAACAAAAMNWPDSPGFGSGGAAAAAATGAPAGTGAAAAAAAGAAGAARRRRLAEQPVAPRRGGARSARGTARRGARRRRSSRRTGSGP